MFLFSYKQFYENDVGAGAFANGINVAEMIAKEAK